MSGNFGTVLSANSQQKFKIKTLIVRILRFIILQLINKWSEKFLSKLIRLSNIFVIGEILNLKHGKKKLKILT